MKIALVINSLKMRGGAEVFVYSLVKELSKNSKDKILLITLFSGIHSSFSDLHSLNIEIKSCSKKKGIDFKAARKFKEIISEFQPDIINTHLSCIPTYFLAFGLKTKKWKLIHTVHNVAEKESVGLSARINKLFCKKERITFIAISDQIAKSIESMYHTDSIKTIYNGCNLFSSSSIPFENREYDMICVARFYEQKNHIFLLNAFSKMVSINPSLKLILVGDGDLKDQCVQLCKDKKIDHNVIFAGAVDNVVEYLSNSKIFVLTSIFEGNPISILEAMSVGLPIVASKVGGVPDVVINDKNGLLFEVGNESEFINCATACLETSNYISISENNLKDSNKHSIQICASNYHHFFEEFYGK